MKPLAAILALALCGCQPEIPRAKVVDTEPLVGATERLGKSTAETSRSIGLAVDAHGRAITVHAAQVREMERLKALVANGEQQIRDAVASVSRLNDELGEELDLTKLALKDAVIKGQQAEKDVATLQGVVTSLVLQAERANETQERMEAIIRDGRKDKDKLTWWRWRFAPVSTLINFALLAFILRKPILRLCGFPVP